MRWRGWILVALLAPVAFVAVGTQIALAAGVAGGLQAALGLRARDTAQLDRGLGALAAAADVLDWTWSSPGARALQANPLTLGVVGEVAAVTHALAAGASTLPPLGEIGAEVLGFDGEEPLISGTTIDTARLPGLSDAVREVHSGLAATSTALAAIPGRGPLGGPITQIADSLGATATDLTALAAAAEVAWPVLPEALGSDGPRRYLICALNDAETFGSGGAPLSAFMVQAELGTLSVPISGQLESKLSPDNPPIRWRHEGGPPWYRTGARYPFVNSNFHPDFRTAGVDMRRAWAALGYPEVEGVITIDVTALATILEWTGGISSAGYGQVTHENLVRKVLVEAYREFSESDEDVLARHARNDALADALIAHLTSPRNVLPAMRGTMDAIPPRHVQAFFVDPRLESAIQQVAVTGALSQRAGDVIGVFSQTGPNKVSVFQERSIIQEVQLRADGGADVRRIVTFTNAVPEGLEGDPTLYRGYTGLLARLRVAHRVPLSATDLGVSTGEATPLVRPSRVGPYQDQHGGQVLWQGQDIPPGDSASVEVRYQLPAGTFSTGRYEVSADPQALPQQVGLAIRVSPPAGTVLPETAGWVRVEGGGLGWTGALDRPLHLVVG